MSGGRIHISKRHDRWLVTRDMGNAIWSIGPFTEFARACVFARLWFSDALPVGTTVQGAFKNAFNR